MQYFNNDFEKEQYANNVLDALVNKKAFPLRDYFRLDNILRKVDPEELEKTIIVSNVVREILLENDLIEKHPRFNLLYRLTTEGRVMMNYEYFMFWKEARGSDVIDSFFSFIDKSVNVDGDNNKTIVGDNNNSDQSSNLEKPLPDLNPIQNPAAKKEKSAAVIIQKIGLWIISHSIQIIVAALGAALGAYFIIKCNIPH